MKIPTGAFAVTIPVTTIIRSRRLVYDPNRVLKAQKVRSGEYKIGQLHLRRVAPRGRGCVVTWQQVGTNEMLGYTLREIKELAHKKGSLHYDLARGTKHWKGRRTK